jgi:hypothetical protein
MDVTLSIDYCLCLQGYSWPQNEVTRDTGWRRGQNTVCCCNSLGRVYAYQPAARYLRSIPECLPRWDQLRVSVFRYRRWLRYSAIYQHLTAAQGSLPCSLPRAKWVYPIAPAGYFSTIHSNIIGDTLRLRYRVQPVNVM